MVKWKDLPSAAYLKLIHRETKTINGLYIPIFCEFFTK